MRLGPGAATFQTAAKRRLEAPAARGGPAPGRLVVATGLAGTLLLSLSARAGFPLPGLRLWPPTTGHAPLLLFVYEAGVILLVRAWVGLCRLSHAAERFPPRRIVAIGVLWSLPLLLGAPLFSTDAGSYAAQGEMVARGIDPYLAGPAMLGGGPYLAAVDPIWRNSPAPYGPLYLSLLGWTARLSGHQPVLTLVGLRLLTVAGLAVVVAFLPRLVRAQHAGTGGPAPWAGGAVLAIAVLNPLVLLHLVADAHNEALMLGLLVAGATLALERRGPARTALGLALLGMAAAVKLPALLGLVFVGWALPDPVAGPARRVLGAAGAIGVGVLVLAAAGWVTGFGWDWLQALPTPARIISPLALASGLGVLLQAGGRLAGAAVTERAALQVARAACLLVASLVAAALLWRSRRLGTVRALGAALAAVALLGPVVHEWYLAWGLVLLAATSRGRWPRLVGGACVAFAVVSIPGGSNVLAAMSGLDVAGLVAGLGILGAAALVPLPGLPGPVPRRPQLTRGGRSAAEVVGGVMTPVGAVQPHPRPVLAQPQGSPE